MSPLFGLGAFETEQIHEGAISATSRRLGEPHVPGFMTGRLEVARSGGVAEVES